MSLTVKIGGVPVSVIEDSVEIDDTIADRSTCKFTIKDLTGLNHYQDGQPVTVDDSARGRIFTGYIFDSSENNLTPNPAINSDITTIDGHYIGDKVYYAGTEYKGRYAGDIATDLLRNNLAAEGVTAAYASANTQTATQWNSGSLNGTIGANNVPGGNLELAPAGAPVSIIESTTAQFSSGFLTSVVAANNTLQPTPTNALKIQADMYVSNLSAAYTYVKFWSGSVAIPAGGGNLNYDIWIDDACPQACIAVDLVFTDGTALRDVVNTVDVNFISPTPANDLRGLATGKWYNRNFSFAPVTGKTIAYATIGVAGNQPGTYTAYVRNAVVNIWTGSAFVTTNLFTGTLLIADPQQLQNIGYAPATLAVVPTYDILVSTAPAYGAKSYRYTNSISIDAVNIIKGSFLAYQATEPANTKIVIKYSIDGGNTLYPCTNNAALPYLLPGLNVAGKNILLLYEFYALAGASPEDCPVLELVELSLYTSYKATKSDVNYNTGAGWSSAGTTLTNTINQTNAAGFFDLTLSGSQRNWDDASDANQDFYSGNIGSASQSANNRQFQIIAPASVDTRSRLTFAGQYQNFVAEVDLKINTVTGLSYGMCYRTTGWQNNNNTFAYAAMISSTQVTLGRGTNSASGSGTFTSIATQSITLSSGNWHRMKIIVNGNSHQIYIDETLVISATDSTYTAAGYLALRVNASSTSGDTAFFDNFGVVTSGSGTWLSPSISLTSAATYGNSLISWLDTSALYYGGSNTSILVEASINGGSTWLSCTNGAVIPNFTANQSLSGVSLQIRVTLTTSTATAMPGIEMLNILVLGAFSSSGSWLSPFLSLAGVGRAGSTLEEWYGVQPTSTNIYVDSSLDNSTFTQIGAGATGAAAIAGIQVQSDPQTDEFNTNSSIDYTSTSLTGGALASWSWDTTNTRLIASGGTNALLIYNTPTIGADVDVSVIMDWSDSGGLVWRYQGDQNNYYELIVHDASAASSANTLQLFKAIAGTRTQIGANIAISFTRNTPHFIRVIMIGSSLTVYFDGVIMLATTDTSITAAGYCGLRNDTNSSQSYMFRVQTFGDDVTSKMVWTRIRLTSTDPTATPQVTNLITSCHSNQISNGAYIPQTNYSILNGQKATLAQIFDDLCKQSGNYFWRIVQGQFYFQPFTSTPAPFPISNKDVLISNAKIVNGNAVYRNSQWITGGKDVLTLAPFSFIGDGVSTTFTLPYPIDSVNYITVNGVAALVGVKGADTGKAWYYKQGDAQIVQDTSAIPLNDTQTLVISINAQIDVTVNMKRDTEIANRAAIDGTSGLIEEAEGVSKDTTKAAMIIKADGYLTQYAVQMKTATFTSMRPGLAVGQIAALFLSPFGIFDGVFLVTQMKTSYKTTSQNGIQVLQPFYDITAVQGPVVGDWTRFISNLARLE